MTNIPADVLRVVDTLANVQADISNRQIAFETTNNRIVVKDAGGSFHYFKTAGDTDILMDDNTADAFRIREDVNNYFTCDTIDGTERVKIWKVAEFYSPDEATNISIYGDDTDYFIDPGEGDLRVYQTAGGNVRLFDGAIEGEVPYFGITGWKSSGTADEIKIAVGVHADQVGSIYGCANGYYFDQMLMIGDSTREAWNTGTWSVVQIGATGAILCETSEAVNRSMYYCQNAYVEGSTWKHIVNDKSSAYLQYDGNHYMRVGSTGAADSTITWRNAYVCYNDPKHYFEIADNTSIVFKIAEGANTYFSINSNTGSRQMNYGTIASTRHSFDMYTSDALAFRIGVDDQDWFVIDTDTPKLEIGNAAANPNYIFLGDGNITGHHVLDTSVPPNPVAGSCYYDDTGSGGTFYIYDGAAWDYTAFTAP